MSFPTPLIHTVKTAMPEVNAASFITVQDNGSWFGRMVQPIKDHPILFAVTAVVIGIIGYVGYNIYKALSSNGSTASNGGDEDLVTQTPQHRPRNVQNKTQAPKVTLNNSPVKSEIETLIGKTNLEINLSSTVTIGNIAHNNAQHNEKMQKKQDEVNQESSRKHQEMQDKLNKEQEELNGQKDTLPADEFNKKQAFLNFKQSALDKSAQIGKINLKPFQI